MTQLADLARVMRSKNAGPTLLTIDVLFAETAQLDWALPALSSSRISSLYGIEAENIRIIPYRPAMAIKIVMPRKLIAGDPGDRDVYGAQQHAPLLGIEV
ncbi:MAG: DUF4387 domain-containing protein [Proteobacteria bacterium]|nr:DUF4387 domain-containing protein [Pseudomonadota bacterium]MDA0981766.1 DUF4387 domain-containing protein [Pseudomonadota bacterium]